MKNEDVQKFWRKCTTCKKAINFGQVYWVCSVSTCNRVRTDLVFCDLKCFDAHVPVMNHRDAGAFERKAPIEKDVKAQQISEMIKTDQSKKRIESELSEEEILVVVSKVKAYIRSCSGMNTSDSVMNLLSQKVRKYANRAIEQAESQGRKTILDRDIL
jgi:histone H3/H4